MKELNLETHLYIYASIRTEICT